MGTPHQRDEERATSHHPAGVGRGHCPPRHRAGVSPSPALSFPGAPPTPTPCPSSRRPASSFSTLCCKGCIGRPGQVGRAPCFRGAEQASIRWAPAWARGVVCQAEGPVGAPLEEPHPSLASISLRGPLPFAPPLRTPTPKPWGPLIPCVTVQSFYWLLGLWMATRVIAITPVKS